MRKGLLNKYIYILFALAFANGIFAQDVKEYELTDIVVSAGRTPIAFPDLARDVEVFTLEEIKETPVNSVHDLLQYVAGIDLKQRGVDGVQADISIRGGNFEQTLILIDGIKVIDPQTGHHNLNLPLTLDNIERVEVLKGQGTKTHGPNAFAGAVNIITKKNTGKELSIHQAAGQNGFYNGSIYAAYNIGKWNNRISYSQSSSDGYRPNTGYDATSFTYGSSMNFSSGAMNLLFGFNEKDFGANSFYSLRYPTQAEHTITKFLNLSGEFSTGIFTFSPKAYWRRNDDEFVLKKEDPSFYKNLHETNVFGSELQISIESSLGVTSFGGEYSKDYIESTNLGKHNRERKGFFLEHSVKLFERLAINFGGFAYNYSSVGWKFWPGIDLGMNITEKIKLYGSFGKAFRIPTYTELYYTDPVTKGNGNLKHEETTNYEAGIKFNNDFVQTHVSYFRKDGKNIIDWVRENSAAQWQAENIGELNTNGFEFGFALNPKRLNKNFPIKSIAVDYTYLDGDRKTGDLDSKYILDFLKNQVVGKIGNELFLDIEQSWVLRYEDRINMTDKFLVDMKLNKEIFGADFYVKGTNIFNTPYEDLPGVPLPGRWIIAGVNYTLK